MNGLFVKKRKQSNSSLNRDIIRVCKKRSYESYAVAYAYASASDNKVWVYECDVCGKYHLTSTQR